jgi:enoyl-[acyl-carrier protein] reductase II
VKLIEFRNRTPFTLRVPHTVRKFSAAIPTPNTVGDFQEMGMPAGEDSVKLIKSIKPAAWIVEEMMGEGACFTGGGGGFRLVRSV